jgi:hypothetical protein
VKHPDLAAAVGDNATFAIGKLRNFGDKYFRHSVRLQLIERRKSIALNRSLRQRNRLSGVHLALAGSI